MDRERPDGITMTKKQRFIQSEQSRDKHPERDVAGSPARVSATAQAREQSADGQQPHSGKLANDHNKVGSQAPTQKNEGRRTPQSRHDRQTLSGGPQNQVEARTGGKGGGRGPRGAG